MKKRVIIIGGGVSGLAAGVYAQKCGFDATILESHSIPGGNCTSWKRKGYLFEGGMHWLGGSKKGSDLNKLWRHTGALNDDVKIHYGEPYVEIRYEGTPIQLYRDVDRTEKEFLALSPADQKEIKAFCNYIRKMKGLSMPTTDIKGVKVTKKVHPPLSMLFAAIRATGVLRRFSSISREEYAKRFSHPGIQELIRALPGGQQGIAMLFLTMGTLATGEGGFPDGGSLPFAARMAQTFQTLGGKLLFNTRAERVVTENGKAVAVIANGNRLETDAVIVANDTMQMDHLFDVPLHAPWLEQMRKTAEPTTCTLVSLGVNADLAAYPERLLTNFDPPIVIADQRYEYAIVNNYANDQNYSPRGKTALTLQLTGDTYAFWKTAKESGHYKDEKAKLEAAVIRALEKQMPEIRDNVEVCDIATPLTYERYCGNWKGSWMTAFTSVLSTKPYPPTIDGLNGVYFSGQRMMPPGGLPPALLTARIAVQHLCRDTDTLFVSEA